MQACDRCHARKTRCDRRIPQCGACEKARVSFVHADKLRQRNIPRGYLDSMEAMVRQLQEENRTLRQSLAEATQALQEPQAPQVSQPSPPFQTATIDSLSSHSEDDDRNSRRPIPEAAPISPPPSSTDTSSPPSNAFAVEVGYLSLIATGETRYLGSSSGLGLANIINTILTAQISMDQDEETSGGCNSSSSAAHTILATPSSSSSPSSYPPSSYPPSSSLPPFSTIRPFVEAYFQHTHITFPLLHRPSFLATVDRIYSEPGYYERNPREAFILDMVLAIGSSNFNRFDESAAASSCRFFAVAQSKLAAMLSMDDTLTALKAILLISQHGIFSNLRDTSTSIWHLVGVGARICIEQGLHLEHRQLGCGDVRLTLDEELRRRCFWSFYNLDRVVSFTLGRPVAIRDEEIDVSLPSHLDDSCFSSDSPVVVSSQPDNGDGGGDGKDQRPLQYQHEPTSSRVSPFLHLIRIRRLSGQILTQFYNSKQQTTMPVKERRQIRRRFHAEIDAWRDATQHLPGLSSSPPSSSASASPYSSPPSYTSSFLTLDWYNAVYSNAILLLYRPSPFLPHPTAALSPDDDGDNSRPDLVELLNAAQSSIESYSRLHQKRRLNYSWITLHGVFIAGLSYIYALGRLLHHTVRFSFVPELFSIIEVTRSCSNILVAICERWNASRRSRDLFNKLSNAVIRDAINASSRQAREKDHPNSSSSNSRRQSEPQVQRQPEPTTMPYDATSTSTSAMNVVLNDGQMQLDENFVMDEFRQFMGSLDASHPIEAPIPSELVAGFLQDWPFDIPGFSTENESGANIISWDLNNS